MCYLGDDLIPQIDPQVDESDVGSDRFQCWILSEPMLDHMGSDNPIGSYWIPGDGIRLEVVGGGSGWKSSEVDPIGLYVGFDSLIRWIKNGLLWYC